MDSQNCTQETQEEQMSAMLQRMITPLLTPMPKFPYDKYYSFVSCVLLIV